MDDLDWIPKEATRTPNIEIRSNDGIRFAALVHIGVETMFEAADYVRSHDWSFLFIAQNNELTEACVRLLFRKVFPKDRLSVDWTEAVNQVVERDKNICVRVTGGFDDREAGVYLFLPKDIFKTVGESDG